MRRGIAVSWTLCLLAVGCGSERVDREIASPSSSAPPGDASVAELLSNDTPGSVPSDIVVSDWAETSAAIAPVPVVTPESVRAAWVAEDPEVRAAALADAGPLDGDACRIVFDESERFFKFGAVPVSSPPTTHLATDGGEALSISRVGDRSS